MVKSVALVWSGPKLMYYEAYNIPEMAPSPAYEESENCHYDWAILGRYGKSCSLNSAIAYT